MSDPLNVFSEDEPVAEAAEASATADPFNVFEGDDPEEARRKEKEKEKIRRAQAAQEAEAKLKAAADKEEAERKAAEAAAAAKKAEREKAERAAREKEELAEKERAEKERVAKERAEKERVAKEAEEFERAERAMRERRQRAAEAEAKAAKEENKDASVDGFGVPYPFKLKILVVGINSEALVDTERGAELVLEIPGEVRVADVLNMIKDKTGVVPKQQHLCFAGHQLNPTVDEFNPLKTDPGHAPLLNFRRYITRSGFVGSLSVKPPSIERGHVEEKFRTQMIYTDDMVKYMDVDVQVEAQRQLLKSFTKVQLKGAEGDKLRNEGKPEEALECYITAITQLDASRVYSLPDEIGRDAATMREKFMLETEELCKMLDREVPQFFKYEPMLPAELAASCERRGAGGRRGGGGWCEC